VAKQEGLQHDMHGLPDDFSCAFFVGKTLEMLCFNANQVYLHFGQRTHIAVEGTYSVSCSGQEIRRFRVPAVNLDLFKLIENKVTSASGARDGTLTLTFANGMVFCCYDDEAAFECYTIRHDGQETYV
jgi:hypothetical protein